MRKNQQFWEISLLVIQFNILWPIKVNLPCGRPNLREPVIYTTLMRSFLHFSLQNIANWPSYDLSGPWSEDIFGQNNHCMCNCVLMDHPSPLRAVLQCPWFALGMGSILAVFLRSSGAPAISWCLTLDFIGVLQWLQAVLRDIDCPAPPRQAQHNADEWTCGPAKSN